MSLLFADSFDHYLTITDKWDTAGTDCSIRLNTGVARTGIGALQINSAAFGPVKTFGHIAELLVALSWNSSVSGYVFAFDNFDAAPGFNGQTLGLLVNIDRSVSVIRRPSSIATVLGQSAAGVVTFNTYNSIAMQATIAVLGHVQVWVNGAKVLDFIANTTHTTNPALLYSNGVTLMGPGGIPVCYIDDVYLLDCSISPNTTFLGARRIYAIVPTADVSSQWTPLSGANWTNVDEIPPDGDTSYNFSSGIGQVDQYEYTLAAVPTSSGIAAIQHCLDMKVDSGARSVASNIEGVSATGIAPLSSGYIIYPVPYDLNPATGLAWQEADFPLGAGPEVTA